MKEQPCDHGVEAAALEGDLGRTRPRGRAGAAGGRWRGWRPGPPPPNPRVCPRPRSPGGPPVAGQDPGRCVPRLGSAHGRGVPGSTPRPPPSRRSPGLVELGEVGGEGRALEPPAVEPSVEADDRKASGQPGGVPPRPPQRQRERYVDVPGRRP